MQNKYVGDIGDFGKYGLLRALCGVRASDGGKELSLGIVWYFVKDKGVSYLDNPDGLRSCDRDLCDALSRIVKGQRRSVASIRVSRIFPDGTVFFAEEVPTRLQDREEWLQQALRETAKCNLVFLDPDNGPAISLKPQIVLKGWPLAKGHASAKFVYRDEIPRYLERGQSLVIIFHAGLWATVDQQVETLLDRLSDIAKGIKDCGRPFALRYHRGAPARVFFVIPAKRDQDILLSRAEQLTQGAWSGHFSLVDPESI